LIFLFTKVYLFVFIVRAFFQLFILFLQQAAVRAHPAHGNMTGALQAVNITGRQLVQMGDLDERVVDEKCDPRVNVCPFLTLKRTSFTHSNLSLNASAFSCLSQIHDRAHVSLLAGNRCAAAV
jgi:hypothetical protein